MQISQKFTFSKGPLGRQSNQDALITTRSDWPARSIDCGRLLGEAGHVRTCSQQIAFELVRVWSFRFQISISNFDFNFRIFRLNAVGMRYRRFASTV